MVFTERMECDLERNQVCVCVVSRKRAFICFVCGRHVIIVMFFIVDLFYCCIFACDNFLNAISMTQNWSHHAVNKQKRIF